jgi:hypothetical protein
MNDLFRSEWRRFHRAALLVAAIHGVALLLLSRVAEVPQLGYDDHAFMLGLYMLLGLVLAFVQVGSYRKVSRWLWLIHRPLPPSRIFGALSLAALAVLATVVLVPLLVFLLATDLFSTQVVDARHYVAILVALAFATMAWLAGAHASTSRHRAAILVLLAPLLLALKLASAWWLLLPVGLCLAWLALVARHGFRADREAPIARPLALLLTALPLQLGFFFVAFQLSKAGLEVVDLLGRSGPGRTILQDDPNVDLEAMLRSYSQAFLSKGLANSTDPRAARWREQIPLLEVAGITSDLARFPVRHQVSNVEPRWWDDKRNIQWTFSHDRMRYAGRDPVSGEPRGWWGREGFPGIQPFHAVPQFGMTRDTLDAVDVEEQRQHPQVRLPAGEWFTARPKQVFGHTLLLTNRRLLAYRQDASATSPFDPPRLDWEVPFAPGQPVPVVELAELLDGWLVSLFYDDNRELDGFDSLIHAWQQVVFVDADGRAAVVGGQPDLRDRHVSLGTPSPLSVPLASWWLSPPLYALAHLPDRLLDTGLTQPPRVELLPDIPLFRALALTLLATSVAGAWLWLRRTRAPAGRRNLWLASCAVLGLPALLSLLCLEPRR